jgi:hypothetical protein
MKILFFYKIKLFLLLGMRAVGISIDCRQQFVYFTDTSGKTIQRMKYDGSEQKIILSGNNKRIKFE